MVEKVKEVGKDLILHIQATIAQARIARKPRPGWTVYALPYVEAMLEIEGIEDKYFLDSAYEVVLRARCNIQQWRGPSAKAMKARMDAMLAACPEDRRI